MSRHTPLDFEFNHEEYIKLIKKAQGSRQQKTFAEDIGITPAYLNRALTGRYKKPFMPEVLKKIASASEERVSNKELLTAAGYDYRKYVTKKKLVRGFSFSNGKELDAEKIRFNENRNSTVTGIITTALTRKGYLFKGISSPDKAFGLQIKLYDLPITEWGFIFLDVVGAPGRRIAFNGIKVVPIFTTPLKLRSYRDYTNSLLFAMAKPKEKISFVTARKATFDRFCEDDIIALAHYVSVILIDEENKKVVEEKVVKTYLDPDESIPVLV